MPSRSKTSVLHDLTSIDEDLTEIDQLASAASLSGSAIDDLARAVLDAGEADTHNLEQLLDESRDGYRGVLARPALRSS